MEGWKVVLFIILGLFLILAVANALTYNRISTIEGNHNVRVCFWLNVVAVILALLAIGWIIYIGVQKEKS